MGYDGAYWCVAGFAMSGKVLEVSGSDMSMFAADSIT